MKSNTRLLAAPLLVAAAALLSGCDTEPVRDPNFAASFPAPAAAPERAQVHNGAIFQTGYDVALYNDARARRIGDVLTIQLTEATKSSKNAQTDVSKTNDTSITNPTILGAKPTFGVPDFLPLDNTKTNTLETNLASNNTFAGKSGASQDNSLTGDIAVTVADVLPNGNLVVRGEKRLNLNQGNEYVKISGIVRPIDIQSNNSVPSTKVADATIIYSGDGAIADSNKLGWIARFFISALIPF